MITHVLAAFILTHHRGTQASYDMDNQRFWLIMELLLQLRVG